MRKNPTRCATGRLDNESGPYCLPAERTTTTIHDPGCTEEVACPIVLTRGESVSSQEFRKKKKIQCASQTVMHFPFTLYWKTK